MVQDDFDYGEFREEVRHALEGLPKKQMVAFAWRCGVRVLPLLGAKGEFNFWEEEKRTKYLYDLFWALDIGAAYASAAYADATYATAYAASAADAADAAYAYADADADAAYAYAASAAAYAASAADAATRAATRAASAASDAARAANGLSLSLTEVIQDDLQQIRHEGGATALLGDYGEIWPNFLQALEKEGCAYWGKLVQQWLESGFNMDKLALERRLNVPAEFRQQGAAAVARYLQGIEQGAKRLNEARIIILGDKGAGKTSIARKLVDPTCELPKPEESTPGVDTTSWQLGEHDFNVRIWDFAGHTVTHAVHQFFLSERCLYILVCNGRTEEYNRLEYWLSQMQIYGGNSEVIILVNKKDIHDHSVPINKLKQKYPIVKLYDFSLSKDQKKIESFREEVIDYVIHHPSWEKQEIPETYYHVKEKLEALFVVGDLENGEECIERELFDEIADELEIKDKEALLRDLHALGISLWYEDIDEVETLVLNPEWISHGIYTLINWVHRQGQHGLSLKQFEEVFADQKKRYPKKEHEFLFKLMKHYQLAFETNKGMVRYLIIPHLLKEDQPASLPDFNVGESLMLRYKSEVDLPSHTISRFIVKHHEEIKLSNKKFLFWQEGVVLEDVQGNTALVLEDNRTISVSVKGNKKTQFLDRLRSTLNDLFKEFKKQKPELQYRVRRFGEILGRGEDLWMKDQRILNLASRNIPHPDEVSGENINLEQTVNHYHITEGNLIQGNVAGSLVRGNQNNFNFENCNIGLQENINELAQLVGENGQAEEAKELKAIAKAVEEAEVCTEPKEIRKSGIGKRLERFTKKLADEGSSLHKAVKNVEDGISTAQDIAKSYNDLAQWCGLPQVPKPFLKKEK